MTQTFNLINSTEMQIKVMLRFPVGMAVIKKTPITVTMYTERDTSILLMGVQTNPVTMKISLELSSKH